MPSDLILALMDKINEPPECRFTIRDSDIVIRPLSADGFQAITDRIGSVAQAVLSVAPESDKQSAQDAVKSLFGNKRDFNSYLNLIKIFKGPLIEAFTNDAPVIIGASLHFAAENPDDEKPVGTAWVLRHIHLSQRIVLIRLIYEVEGVREVLGEVFGQLEDTLPEEIDPATPNQTEEEYRSTLPPLELPLPEHTRPISHLKSPSPLVMPESFSSSTPSSTSDSPKLEKPVKSSRQKPKRAENND